MDASFGEQFVTTVARQDISEYQSKARDNYLLKTRVKYKNRIQISGHFRNAIVHCKFQKGQKFGLLFINDLTTVTGSIGEHLVDIVVTGKDMTRKDVRLLHNYIPSTIPVHELKREEVLYQHYEPQ